MWTELCICHKHKPLHIIVQSINNDLKFSYASPYDFFNYWRTNSNSIDEKTITINLTDQSQTISHTARVQSEKEIFFFCLFGS